MWPTITDWLRGAQGWLLGLEGAEELRIENLGFGAVWTQGSGRFWVWFGAACLVVIAYLFYVKFQTRGTKFSRAALATCRALLLIFVFLTLADPFIRLYNVYQSPPLLYVLVDGTESMAIEDELSGDEQAALAEALGLDGEAPEKPSRIDLVKAAVQRPDEQNLLRRLREEKAARVEAFVFEGANTSQLRRLTLSESADDIDPQHLAAQLSATGQVTALGAVMDGLSGQLGKSHLAGVVMISDFAQNAGRAPVGDTLEGRTSPVTRLNVPVYTVGVGATEVVNLSIDIRPDVKMKRAERSNIGVKWSQTGLKGKVVTVRVRGHWLDGTDIGKTIDVGEETVAMDDNVGVITMPFTPEEAGQLELTAEVDVQQGEINEQDNVSQDAVRVIDDHLNLMYVAYEPDWEWRFVKEVFHRDKLVGIEGFRTYLRSADPKVRQHNQLFLPTLTPKRSEFFANDIIFLGDMPASALSQRFCELTKEFVADFGGGLVVIAGPRFGPGELAGTPLEDMLPVRVDPAGKIRDLREFVLELTPHGQAAEFMRLGDGESDAENIAAWRNLGPLPWYQPVRGIVEGYGEVLAQHPTDLCPNGKTKQPIIARRPYGKGEVIYIGFNEMWRIRRKHGELYYRQFWSQLMNRLALSHALGNQKRFVVRTDREKYNVDERATIIVEAFDENFERLKPERLPEGQLTAEVFAPGNDAVAQTLTLTPLRDGEFEARVAADMPGEWRVRVKDPIAEEYRDVRFRVASLSAERRSAQRNADLQRQIALASGGGSYDLTDIDRLVNDLDLQPRTVVDQKVKPLWATPLWFILVVGLMVGEWFTRKMMNMT